MKEALLYEKLKNNFLHCYLCSHHCRIPKGKFGLCGVRQNLEGSLYTHAYGQVVACHVDPVEKKPLYHFLPGSLSFSVAAAGCNFHCGFCQNWEISQVSCREGEAALNSEDFPPEEIVAHALANGCRSISYTYSEPTVFFEYALDTAKIACQKGLLNIFVTNGYMTKEALELIRPYLAAANVDLKFFRDDSYRHICGGSLQPVLDSIRLMKAAGLWVEITTLIVPGENDSAQELGDIAAFIASVDKDMPWHISRFHPDYKFGGYAVTPDETLKKAEGIGFQAGLNFIYAGNVYGWGSQTHCPGCKRLLVERQGFRVLEYNIQDDRCNYCTARVPGIF
ncbi:MAG: AmmeMemoRadiSam system radical SAM enzyme [Candidatus Omnitrophota bacterium]